MAHQFSAREIRCFFLLCFILIITAFIIFLLLPFYTWMLPIYQHILPPSMTHKQMTKATLDFLEYVSATEAAPFPATLKCRHHYLYLGKGNDKWPWCPSHFPSNAVVSSHHPQHRVYQFAPIDVHDEVKPCCVIYGFGVGESYDFEQQIRDNTLCEVHLFDPTLGWPDKQLGPRLHFHNLGLGAINTDHFLGEKMGIRGRKQIWKTRTLDSIMSLLNHSFVDLVKIDIEGMEWAVLEQLLSLQETAEQHQGRGDILSPLTRVGAWNMELHVGDVVSSWQFTQKLKILKRFSGSKKRIMMKSGNESESSSSSRNSSSSKTSLAVSSHDHHHGYFQQYFFRINRVGSQRDFGLWYSKPVSCCFEVGYVSNSAFLVSKGRRNATSLVSCPAVITPPGSPGNQGVGIENSTVSLFDFPPLFILMGLVVGLSVTSKGRKIFLLALQGIRRTQNRFQ